MGSSLTRVSCWDPYWLAQPLGSSGRPIVWTSTQPLGSFQHTRVWSLECIIMMTLNILSIKRCHMNNVKSPQTLALSFVSSAKYQSYSHEAMNDVSLARIKCIARIEAMLWQLNDVLWILTVEISWSGLLILNLIQPLRCISQKL